MTTDPALRALREALIESMVYIGWGRENAERWVADRWAHPFVRAALAAAEAAPLDVERLARALDLAERTGGNYRDMERYRWLAGVTAAKYAALRSPDTETP